jgi:hypothetical protein
MGSFEIGRISLYQWDRTASPDAHFLLIDNSGYGSAYPALFERGFLGQERWSYHQNATNVGLVASCQQAYNFALGMDADILVLTHNDVWVYPEHILIEWDNYIANVFRSGVDSRLFGEKVGVIGLFGSKGCGREGHRLDTFGSLIEIAGHGRQMTEWIEPAVCLDGFFLACSMKMLQASRYRCLCDIEDGSPSERCPTCKGRGVQIGGFDQRYQWHHVYDYDISLTSIELGYCNAVLNIPCHHLSGLTANNDAYSTSGPDVHAANYQRWLEKWTPKLGVKVDAEWRYTWRCGQ